MTAEQFFEYRRELREEQDVDNRFPKDCYCRDDVRDIFSLDMFFMNQPVAQLQMFITDKAELELYMEGVPDDVVMIKKKIPIHFCPFCGRSLSGKETTHDETDDSLKERRQRAKTTIFGDDTPTEHQRDVGILWDFYKKGDHP